MSSGPVEVSRTAARRHWIAAMAFAVFSTVVLAVSGCSAPGGVPDIVPATLAGPVSGPFVSLDANGYHVCALNGEGEIACWGDVESGRLTPPAGSFTEVATGLAHTCALDHNGAITCWGDNFDGRAEPPAGTFVELEAGDQFSCALDARGGITCWGNNDSGRATAPAGKYVAMASFEWHSCAIDEVGSVTCWGRSDGGGTIAPVGSFTSVVTAVEASPVLWMPQGRSHAGVRVQQTARPTPRSARS